MVRAVTRRPSGSVIGPILFNIYLNDLFYLTEMTQVCNFTDDTTFYACDVDRNLNFDEYVFKLCKKASRKLSTWFLCR